MDSILKKEINVLKCYKIFHIIMILLLLMCHFLAHSKYLLIYKSTVICFILGISIYFINLIFISLTTIIIFLKKYSPTLLYNINRSIKIFSFISVIKGTLLTFAFWYNYPKYGKFIQNCPYDFTPKQAISSISSIKSDKLKEICELKRCIFQNSDNKYYKYICNFNPYYSKEYSKNSENSCYYISLNSNINSNIYQYLKQCNKYSNFYICNYKEKQHDDDFYLKNDLRCPIKYRPYRILILGFLFILIDIIADLVIFLFIHCQYNIIIKIINYENILRERYSCSSLNSTKDSSIVINNYNQNNNNILPQLNNNMQTEVYISQNILEGKVFGNKDKNQNKIKIEYLEKTSSKNKLSESKNELIDSGIIFHSNILNHNEKINIP